MKESLTTLLKKDSNHNLKFWMILLIVLLFGLSIGLSFSFSVEPKSQQGSSIKSQLKYVDAITVMSKDEQAYLCAKQDGTDSYIASFGGLFNEFWTNGYLCKILPTRQLSEKLFVLETPTPERVMQMYSTSNILMGPGVNQRPYKYQCRHDLSIHTVDHTPPPSPSPVITIAGNPCDLLQ